jgi:prepilin-type N-terminal cleavage/methylation domain-containing protein
MKGVIMKKAFTLAEVLITLGIIGVVAAITLPTLIENYKEQVYVNQLKKTISTIEQGINLMMAEDGVDSIENTELYINMRKNSEHGECSASSEDSACQTFYENFSKYFKGSKIAKAGKYIISYPDKDNNQPVDGSNSEWIFLSDGSMMSFDTTDYLEWSTHFIIDVNGLKKPNKYGSDIFELKLTKSGKFDFSYDENLEKIIQNGWKIN